MLHKCKQRGERQHCIQVHTDCAGPVKYHIHSVGIWDSDVNWNKLWHYMLRQPEEKKHSEKQTEKSPPIAFISSRFTICDWTYHNSQNTAALLIRRSSVARSLIRTLVLEVFPSLTVEIFQKRLQWNLSLNVLFLIYLIESTNGRDN